MPPGRPVLLVLVETTPLCESVRALIKSGDLTAVAVMPGRKAPACLLISAEDLGRIDSHLEQWMHDAAETFAVLQERYALLTPREREAFAPISSGMLNKQAASILRISEATLQIHRRRIMRKMKASSFAELVRMADNLGIAYNALEMEKVGNVVQPPLQRRTIAARTAVEGAI